MGCWGVRVGVKLKKVLLMRKSCPARYLRRGTNSQVEGKPDATSGTVMCESRFSSSTFGPEMRRGVRVRVRTRIRKHTVAAFVMISRRSPFDSEASSSEKSIRVKIGVGVRVRVGVGVGVLPASATWPGSIGSVG